MLTLLSPAKSLDLTSRLPTRKHSDARLLDESARLIDVMLTKSPEEIGALMSISDDLASLNAQRQVQILLLALEFKDIQFLPARSAGDVGCP